MTKLILEVNGGEVTESDKAKILALFPQSNVTLSKVKPRLEIHGRRWWQKTYGNTYHSVEVLIDGVKVAHEPFAYGYGNEYSATAVKLLKHAGIVPKDHHARSAYFLSDLFEVFEAVEDVERKKDL